MLDSRSTGSSSPPFPHPLFFALPQRGDVHVAPAFTRCLTLPPRPSCNGMSIEWKNPLNRMHQPKLSKDSTSRPSASSHGSSVAQFVEDNLPQPESGAICRLPILKHLYDAPPALIEVPFPPQKYQSNPEARLPSTLTPFAYPTSFPWQLKTSHPSPILTTNPTLKFMPPQKTASHP